MKTTCDFLDAVKSKHGLASDYALASVLGITRSSVSKFRVGKDFLGDSTAIRVAQLLEMDPAKIIASVHFERAKKDDERAAWASILEKLGGVAAALVLGVGLIGLPCPAEAAVGANVYYVK